MTHTISGYPSKTLTQPLSRVHPATDPALQRMDIKDEHGRRMNLATDAAIVSQMERLCHCLLLKTTQSGAQDAAERAHAMSDSPLGSLSSPRWPARSGKVPRSR
ncbi:MAG: hypothetical protein HY778_05195 [Betaproteobacteria bacterium]|nr:hypothetical protein [Betaproteobacteria bacterium]